MPRFRSSSSCARRALHRLAVLSGREPRALLGWFADIEPLPDFPLELRVGVPADLLRNRPDIRSLERQLASQSAQVGVATAALYPAFQLTGSWDWLTTELDDLFDDDFALGGFGPAISIPVFNAGRLRSGVSAEEAELRRIELALRQSVLVAQEEVENALIAIVRDRERVVLLAEAVGSAMRTVELSQQLYTSGQSDFQNVLDAQRSLFSLEDELAAVRLEVLLDVVDLYLALGGGWGEEPLETGEHGSAQE